MVHTSTPALTIARSNCERVAINLTRLSYKVKGELDRCTWCSNAKILHFEVNRN